MTNKDWLDQVHDEMRDNNITQGQLADMANYSRSHLIILSFNTSVTFSFVLILASPKYQTEAPLTFSGLAVYFSSFSISLLYFLFAPETTSGSFHGLLAIDGLLFSLALIATADALISSAESQQSPDMQHLTQLLGILALAFFFYCLILLTYALSDTQFISRLFDTASLKEWKYWLSRNHVADAETIDKLSFTQPNAYSQGLTWPQEIQEALYEHLKLDNPLHRPGKKAVGNIIGGGCYSALSSLLALDKLIPETFILSIPLLARIIMFLVGSLGIAFVFSLRSYYWRRLESEYRKISMPNMQVLILKKSQTVVEDRLVKPEFPWM
ncbi:MAG: hypothetical protein ABF532_09155 [Bifidobacterium sp.]|jgi:hypothetical protein|uniref:hypothetical protein n=1 Tax=Bifidobacterium sp. TaxID=41200 RepID=UPI0039ED07A2